MAVMVIAAAPSGPPLEIDEVKVVSHHWLAALAVAHSELEIQRQIEYLRPGFRLPAAVETPHIVQIWTALTLIDIG
jgi:hypothetical protein